MDESSEFFCLQSKNHKIYESSFMCSQRTTRDVITNSCSSCNSATDLFRDFIHVYFNASEIRQVVETYCSTCSICCKPTYTISSAIHCLQCSVLFRENKKYFTIVNRVEDTITDSPSDLYWFKDN